MTVANYCILVACALPVVCAGIAKSKGFGKRLRDGGFDNHYPRAWLAKLSGWQARADAAQANSFEALPLFIAGVLAAQQLGAAQQRIDMLALSFVTFRLIYIGLYLADQPSLRSLAWAAAFGSGVALFFA
ncbi:MAG TPA: MAPEG family protein [Roseateles sp.]|nr:MAPEG family protein [Roseateles sp.]